MVHRIKDLEQWWEGWDSLIHVVFQEFKYTLYEIITKVKLSSIIYYFVLLFLIRNSSQVRCFIRVSRITRRVSKVNRGGQLQEIGYINETGGSSFKF